VLDVWTKHTQQFKIAYKGSWRNLEPHLLQDNMPFKLPFQIKPIYLMIQRILITS